MMKQVMIRAWELAKEGAAKFGGSSKEYLAEAMKMAWSEFKKTAKIEHSIDTVKALVNFMKCDSNDFDRSAYYRHEKSKPYSVIFFNLNGWKGIMWIDNRTNLIDDIKFEIDLSQHHATTFELERIIEEYNENGFVLAVS